MSYRNFLNMTDSAERKILEVREMYRKFNDEENAKPKIIVNVPSLSDTTTQERLDSPELALTLGLKTIQNHIDVGDDYSPQLRIEFGTGQVAHAFGCEMYIPNNSPACNKGPMLSEPEDVETLEMPSIYDGWMSKVYEYTKYYMAEKPDIVEMQIPDYQGPFNNAELVRGPDILYDFYDCPEYVEMLLKKMTDYQIELTKYYRKLANIEDGYFSDWGCYWKGAARIANCSLDLVSTEFYNTYIKKYDEIFYDAIGGGRIHYCGGHDNGLVKSIGEIEKNNGLDLDLDYHDVWNVCENLLPKRTVLNVGLREQELKRFLEGDIPNKKNVVYSVGAKNIEEGKDLYNLLKSKFQNKFGI